MKKACVVTYCEWSSYGSIMQAIGLKTALNSIGCQSFIVKDSPAPITSIKTPFKIGKHPRQIFVNMYNNMLRKKTDLRHQRSLAFINKNVDIVYYNNYDALQKPNSGIGGIYSYRPMCVCFLGYQNGFNKNNVSENSISNFGNSQYNNKINIERL